MGEKVKVNKTDRQLLSNLIYTLFKHHILYSTECVFELKKTWKNVSLVAGSKE